MTVWCECENCIYCKGNICSKEKIYIKDTFYADEPATCSDYEEHQPMGKEGE